MDEDLALDLAARAAAAAGSLNQLMDSPRNKPPELADETRTVLLDRIAEAVSSLSGCIAAAGHGSGVDPDTRQYLSRVSERVWESVKGLLTSLVTHTGRALAEDPEALLRAKVAEVAWLTGTEDGLSDQLTGGSPAGGPEGYLGQVLDGSRAGEVLAEIGVSAGQADPVAGTALAAYSAAYATAAGLPLPGDEAWAALRYLAGQEIVTPYGKMGVLDGKTGAGGNPRVLRHGQPVTVHRAAITRPLVLTFTSERKARAVMQAMAARQQDWPVADGDIVTVRRTGATWLACGRNLIPVASFPSDSGRYAASTRLARKAIPATAGRTTPSPAPALKPAAPSPAVADIPDPAQAGARQAARPVRRRSLPGPGGRRLSP